MECRFGVDFKLKSICDRAGEGIRYCESDLIRTGSALGRHPVETPSQRIEPQPSSQHADCVYVRRDRQSLVGRVTVRGEGDPVLEGFQGVGCHVWDRRHNERVRIREVKLKVAHYCLIGPICRSHLN